MILCLSYIRLSSTLVFSALSPIFTSILSVVILKEKFYPRYILGLIICFSGCMVLILNDKSSPISNQITIDNTTYSRSGFESEVNSHILEDKSNVELINMIIGCLFGISHTLTL